MALSRRLLRVGVRRGVLGGSRPFLVVAGIAGAWRLIQALSGSVKETVYLEDLPPGTELRITHRSVSYSDIEGGKGAAS